MADASVDSVELIARDIRVVWAAFKRIEAVAGRDKGLFSNACAIAVSAELQTDSEESFDVIKYTKLACQLQTLFNKK